MLGHVGHILAIYEDLSLIGSKHAGDNIEHGTLASTIASNNGYEVAVVEGQVKVI